MAEQRRLHSTCTIKVQVQKCALHSDVGCIPGTAGIYQNAWDAQYAWAATNKQVMTLPWITTIGRPLSSMSIDVQSFAMLAEVCNVPLQNIPGN